MGIQPSLEILTATKVAISMLELRVPAWLCFGTKAHIKEFGYSLLFWVLEAKHRSNKVFADKLSFSTAQRIALRGVVPLNAQTNQGTSPSGRRRRRSAPATIRKRSWGIPAERWAVHREILVGIVRHYPAAFKSGWRGVCIFELSRGDAVVRIRANGSRKFPLRLEWSTPRIVRSPYFD